jgi:hypothetical protein
VPPPAAADGFALGPCVPTPARGNARIAFTLPCAGPARLALFDLQGRRVRVALDGGWRAAGRHEVVLRLDGLAPGLYSCCLEWMGRRAVRKLVVVR